MTGRRKRLLSWLEDEMDRQVKINRNAGSMMEIQSREHEMKNIQRLHDEFQNPGKRSREYY